MIQLTDVQVFLEILGAGSFSAAARNLKLPKSSVARQISRLEEEVGCPLLTRSARAVSLTEDGRTFVPHARRLLDDGIEAQNALRMKGKGAGGLLTIATTGLIGRRYIIPGLPTFLNQHPRIRAAVWLGGERHVIGTGPGEVDIAIRLRTVASPDMGYLKLGDIDFCMVASPQYLTKRGIPRKPEDLSDHSLIELGPYGKTHRLLVSNGDRSVNVSFTPLLHIDDPEGVRLGVIQGAGIAVLPTFLVIDDLESGTLREVLPEWRQAPIPVNILYRTHVAPPIRVRAYVDYLLDSIGKTQPWRVR